MKASLWNGLEVLSTQAALLVEWQEALGDDFDSARVFLRPTHQQVDSYPCTHPLPCGCRHRVVFESEEDVSAVCDCDEGGCDAIFLRPEDLVVYALNGQLLASRICEAFQFEKMESPPMGDVRSSFVGCWGLRRSSVFFFVPMGEKNLLDETDRFRTASVDPFVLLTPTARFCTPLVMRALRQCGAAHMSLAGLITLASPSQLAFLPRGKETAETILKDFGRRIAEGTSLERAIARVEGKLSALSKDRKADGEAIISDEVARRAFALVNELETGPRLKTPSFLTVFRLYCVEHMSARQIAERCNCSKTSVIERLQAIAKRIGTPLGPLRQFSSQFDQMENGLDDWRAKKIDRRELADIPIENEDEA